MSELDEVMMRNKSGSLSSHMEKLQRPSTAAVFQEKKPQQQQQQHVVADLISLDTKLVQCVAATASEEIEIAIFE